MNFFNKKRLANTDDINAAIDYLERKLTLRGGSGVTVSRSKNGTSVSAMGGGVAGTVAVKWAKTQAALTTNTKLSVKLLVDDDTSPAEVTGTTAFDVWPFYDRRATFDASTYFTPDGTALGSGALVLVGQDQHGDWYLLQPTLILACAAE